MDGAFATGISGRCHPWPWGAIMQRNRKKKGHEARLLADGPSWPFQKYSCITTGSALQGLHRYRPGNGLLFLLSRPGGSNQVSSLERLPCGLGGTSLPDTLHGAYFYWLRAILHMRAAFPLLTLGPLRVMKYCTIVATLHEAGDKPRRDRSKQPTVYSERGHVGCPS